MSATAHPGRPAWRDGTRVRNALRLRRGDAGAFDWTPERLPEGFGVETVAPPATIASAARQAAAEGDDWTRARALATMLVRHARRDGPIRADLDTTWKRIVAGDGYCADYVRVYMAAAHAVGLFCRQWSFSFDGFGGHGHTFVEVWDRQKQAWAFLDVHNNVYAVARGDARPLPALELRERLQRAPEEVEFVAAGPGRLGWEQPQKLRDYYRRGAEEWYLWWGNDVVSRSQRGVAGLLGRVSGRLAHRVGALTSRTPLVALPTADNEPALRRLEALRGRLRLLAVAAAALLAMLLAVYLWPHRGRA